MYNVMQDEKVKFYELADEVAAKKGAEWVNCWTEANPIDNFVYHVDEDEIFDMSNELTPEGLDISFIDYRLMTTKLQADIRGH